MPDSFQCLCREFVQYNASSPSSNVLFRRPSSTETLASIGLKSDNDSLSSLPLEWDDRKDILEPGALLCEIDQLDPCFLTLVHLHLHLLPGQLVGLEIGYGNAQHGLFGRML